MLLWLIAVILAVVGVVQLLQGQVILAIVLFIAEVKVTSHGMLAVGGIIALVLGLGMLFRSPDPVLRVSRSLIAGLAVVAAAVAVSAMLLAARARRNPVATGREGLLGARAVARTALTPAGKVFLQGEWWNAVAEGDVAAGEAVEVVAVDGMILRVRREPERS